jgi:hypothetical protein
MKSVTPYYLITDLKETSFDHQTGEINYKVNRLSRWYSNEQIFENTRARRRIARKMYKNNPLYAFKVMKEAMPGYDYDTFWRDCQPTKKGKSRVPYSAKKEWIRKQIKRIDELNQRQINSLIDQMYNGTDWRIEVNTSDGIYVLTFDQKTSPNTLHLFVEWINQKRRSIKEIDEYRKKFSNLY